MKAPRRLHRLSFKRRASPGMTIRFADGSAWTCAGRQGGEYVWRWAGEGERPAGCEPPGEDCLKSWAMLEPGWKGSPEV